MCWYTLKFWICFKLKLQILSSIIDLEKERIRRHSSKLQLTVALNEIVRLHRNRQQITISPRKKLIKCALYS